MNGGGSGRDEIVAVVTLHPDTVRGGGAPVFFAADEKSLERTALLLAKMTGAAVHDLEGGTYVIVRH